MPENKTSSQIAKVVCTIAVWTDGVFCGACVYRTVDSKSVARAVEEVRVPTSFPSTNQSGKPRPWTLPLYVV